MRARARGAAVGIDIGGTFTDLVMVHPRTGDRVIEKILTTADDPSRAVLDGLAKILAKSDLPIDRLGLVAHATTLATNTVIEGKGAKVALITTRGFRDILEIRTESRYDIYDLELVLPPPLVPRNDRHEIDERVDHTGAVVLAPDRDQIRALLESLRDEGIRDIAVCLVHSYANPAHEKLVRTIAEQTSPEFRVSLSSELCPEIREYPRVSTTVINAYIRPKIIDYVDRLEAGLADAGFGGSLYIMSSAGGVLHPQGAKLAPAGLVESGPAAGVLAACHFGKLTGRARVMAFDMGGTTAKASLVEDGQPVLGQEFEAARVKRFKRGSGYAIRMPVVELIEIGAGGGSIAWIDSMNLLKVGPEGAGAAPGPACYGLGGTRPTVTDADLVLGYLDPGYFLGGRMTLDLARAQEAIRTHIADPLGISVRDAARGIFEVVTENMASAARIHAIERGFDPRQFSLLAFGGAGPVHAHRVAQRLGMKEVIFPVAAGVASAAGLLVSPAASHRVSTWLRNLETLDERALEAVFQRLEKEGGRDLARLHVERYTTERRLEIRYVGQGHEVDVGVPARTRGWKKRIRKAFEAEYERLFGRLPGALPVEIINCRVSVTGSTGKVDICPVPQDAGRTARKGRRRAYFPDLRRYAVCEVLDRAALAPGSRVAGPAIVEEPECTIIVPPQASCRVDPVGNLIMTHRAGASR